MTIAGGFLRSCVGTLTAGLLAVALTALLTACGQGESNVAKGNREGVLHFGNGTEPQSLDPHVMSGSPEVNIARALFEGLVTRNPITLELDPGAAERWETSADGKVLTFYLNRAARWSNGDPVTAEDFAWSLRRSLNPKMGNQVAYQLYSIVGAQAYAEGKKDASALGVEVMDQHTLRITLNNPNPFFLGTMGTYPAYPVHRATVEAHGKATDRYSGWTRPENFVGNGPFELSEWKLQRRVVVTKSETYWDADNVALNGVVFHPVEKATAEEKMFRVGQLHHTQLVPLSKIPGYRKYPDSPYRQAPFQGSYYLMFNVERAPVDDLRVRQALALAIDREALVNKVLQGTELGHNALIPAGTPGYTSPDILGHDPDRARALLAEAGFPNGKGWPGIEYLFNTSENHRQIAVTLQQMWKEELNIDVSLVNLEWKVFLDTTDNGDFTLARRGWVVTNMDPASFLNTFTSDSGVNNSRFSNARYDEIMLELAPAAADTTTRLALLQEAETLLLQNVPLVPLYTYNSKHLVQPSVKGAPPNLFDIQSFKYISLDPDTPVWKGGD
jgi:oligopeptide transport system substrate-binding protein